MYKRQIPSTLSSFHTYIFDVNKNMPCPFVADIETAVTNRALIWQNEELAKELWFIYFSFGLFTNEYILLLYFKFDEKSISYFCIYLAYIWAFCICANAVLSAEPTGHLEVVFMVAHARTAGTQCEPCFNLFRWRGNGVPCKRSLRGRALNWKHNPLTQYAIPCKRDT